MKRNQGDNEKSQERKEGISRENEEESREGKIRNQMKNDEQPTENMRQILTKLYDLQK